MSKATAFFLFIILLNFFSILIFDKYKSYDKSTVIIKPGMNLEEISKKGLWLFGFLSYDLKNELETLNSQNEDRLGFPGLIFFEPKSSDETFPIKLFFSKCNSS